MIVLLYLSAIVAANLVTTVFGPSASVVTAFAFIGLNITARDRLHDAWSGAGLRWKMLLLIASGAVLSWAINRNAASIAVASFVAFALSEGVDAVVYHRLRDRPWVVRVNGSNTFSAAVDSLVFPTLAFGALMPVIVIGQFVAKVFGGSIWAWVLRPRTAAVVVGLLLLAAPAQSQIASVGVGRLVVDDFTDEVVEVYVAAPAFIGIRPNVILSVPTDDLWSRPTVVAQLSVDPWRSVGFDAGVVDTPFAKPEATVGAHAIHPIGPLTLTVTHSYQPRSETQTTVVKLGLTRFWR